MRIICRKPTAGLIPNGEKLNAVSLSKKQVEDVPLHHSCSALHWSSYSWGNTDKEIKRKTDCEERSEILCS